MNVLAEYSDVYIHIDSSVNEELFQRETSKAANVRFISREYRKRCWWWGAEVIKAEIELLRTAMQWFKHAFPVDELFFNTIIMNSPFVENIFYNNTEPVKGLVNLRNLHYFEYPTVIKIFTLADLSMLKKREELYIRKVNTKESSELRDAIDELHMSKCP